MKDKKEILNFLQSLQGNSDLPDEMANLDEQQLRALKHYMEAVIERERAGLDSLFSSITHTMKFIPNVLLQSLTMRYIEPPIAARITEKLSTKQAVAVANGLSAEYVAQTSQYMSAEGAAKLLAGMQVKKASRALAVALDTCPEVALGIIENLESHVRKRLLTKEQVRGYADQDIRERLSQIYRLS